jgi:multidrug efflux pump subunit AcrA (membrane-fusion protein)
MAKQILAAKRSAQRGFGRAFDAMGARPFGIAVFGLSVALLVYLQVGVVGSIRADAVALAPVVDHPARVASFVTEVYVSAGDTVAIGTPLVVLSPHFINRELDRIDLEVQKLLQESKLAQARLLVEEQRWLDPQMRLRPDRPSLERPTEALYAKEIEAMQVRRTQLLEDREALTITANFSGRVVVVAEPGSAVAIGSSVASVTPEYAHEIVAYVPSEMAVSSIEIGTEVRIARPALTCRAPAAVLRRGATVQEAPGQLRSMFRFPIHGTPVYISIPSDCQLGVGQVLSVEFPRAVM